MSHPPLALSLTFSLRTPRSLARSLPPSLAPHMHSECPGVPGPAKGTPSGAAGKCSVLDSCVTLHVIRCRYCAKNEDSLSRTARDFGLPSFSLSLPPSPFLSLSLSLSLFLFLSLFVIHRRVCAPHPQAWISIGSGCGRSTETSTVPTVPRVLTNQSWAQP